MGHDCFNLRPFNIFCAHLVAAFSAENIEALKYSQWWMFVLLNFAILKIQKELVIELKILYWLWIFLTASMQLAIWWRVFYEYRWKKINPKIIVKTVFVTSWGVLGVSMGILVSSLYVFGAIVPIMLYEEVERENMIFFLFTSVSSYLFFGGMAAWALGEPAVLALPGPIFSIIFTIFWWKFLR